MKPRCQTCLWWDRQGYLNQTTVKTPSPGGMCRRAAPRPLDPQHGPVVIAWPVTLAEDWCGDWDLYREA